MAPGLFDGLVEGLLDASIVFSFDRTGFARHARAFARADLDVDLAGKTAVVTGANSGIGYETAAALAGLGATVVLACRDEKRGKAAAASIQGASGSEVRAELLDVAEGASIRAFARRLSRGKGSLDILVHNAGVLPDRREETGAGLERTLATNLAGPHLLTRLLLPALERAGGARVVFVSSGGMYARRLDVPGLASGGSGRPEAFDGVEAYARTKRAQVVLAGLWAGRVPPARVAFNSMHPGWADTPAVRTSLPRFWRLTKGILRTPAEGADTVVWLAASPAAAGRSGLFWFDRASRSPWLVPGTRETGAERLALWDACEGWADRMLRGG